MKFLKGKKGIVQFIPLLLSTPGLILMAIIALAIMGLILLLKYSIWYLIGPAVLIGLIVAFIIMKGKVNKTLAVVWLVIGFVLTIAPHVGNFMARNFQPLSFLAIGV